MYYIYHIPDFVHTDGTKGKIGCTEKNRIDIRINENTKNSLEPFNFWEIIETHDCIDIAAKREIELQKKYGYRLDGNRYNKMKIIGSKGKKSILQYDLNGNLLKEWDSATDATNKIGGYQAGICRVCKGERKSYRGFIWKYKN